MCLSGHQLVAHLVDGHAVPASHFGVILDWDQYQQFVVKLEQQGVEFVIEPYVRFTDRQGEEATLFVRDPSNTYLEFKDFWDIEMLFDKDLESY